MADVPAPQRLAALREQFAALSANVDAAALEAHAGELEDAMGAPGFWDDQDTAAKVSAEHARVTRRLEEFRGLAMVAAHLREAVAAGRARCVGPDLYVAVTSGG